MFNVNLLILAYKTLKKIFKYPCSADSNTSHGSTLGSRSSRKAMLAPLISEGTDGQEAESNAYSSRSSYNVFINSLQDSGALLCTSEFDDSQEGSPDSSGTGSGRHSATITKASKMQNRNFADEAQINAIISANNAQGTQINRGNQQNEGFDGSATSNSSKYKDYITWTEDELMAEIEERRRHFQFSLDK